MDRIYDTDLDELGEVVAEPASYQVWVLGYDENEAITDYEVLVKEFHDPDAAIAFAKNYIDTQEYLKLDPPAEIAYAEVLVETVVDEEDWEENIGTLFYGTISFRAELN